MAWYGSARKVQCAKISKIPILTKAAREVSTQATQSDAAAFLKIGFLTFLIEALAWYRQTDTIKYKKIPFLTKSLGAAPGSLRRHGAALVEIVKISILTMVIGCMAWYASKNNLPYHSIPKIPFLTRAAPSLQVAYVGLGPSGPCQKWYFGVWNGMPWGSVAK